MYFIMMWSNMLLFSIVNFVCLFAVSKVKKVIPVLSTLNARGPLE